MPAQSLNHYTIKVRDLERTKDFYQDIVGLKVGERPPLAFPGYWLYCGDVPTVECLAATALLREHLPDVKVRVVNVVDLFKLLPSTEHPHGMTDDRFTELFTERTDVVFAFHGYPGAVHQLLHGRPNAARP